MPAMEFDQLIEKINEKRAYPVGTPAPIDFVPKVLLQHFKDYLAPDSAPYFSALNPVFSIELEYSNDTRLSSVNVFSLRDGVLPLLKFFILNPFPMEKGPVFIIDERLSPLVPQAWREHVLLKKLHIKNEGKEHRKKNLFFISAIESALPMDLFCHELDQLSEHLQKDDELYLYFSHAILRGSLETSLENKVWGQKLLVQLIARFNHHSVQVLGENEYRALNLSEFGFHLFNPLQYFFSDSFLVHEALQRGARPLLSSPLPQVVGKSHFHPVGHHHGHLLHQNFAPFSDFGASNYKQAITELTVVEKDKSFSPRTLAFATKELKDWAQDVARELHRC